MLVSPREGTAMAHVAAATAAEAYETADELAKRWKTSKRTVQRRTAAGQLPFVKIGRAIRYPVRLVDEVLAADAEALRQQKATAAAVVSPVDHPRRKRRTVQP